MFAGLHSFTTEQGCSAYTVSNGIPDRFNLSIQQPVIILDLVPPPLQTINFIGFMDSWSTRFQLYRCSVSQVSVSGLLDVDARVCRQLHGAVGMSAGVLSSILPGREASGTL